MRLEEYQPTPPAEVSCSSDGSTSTLCFVRHFAHSPDRVWRALVAREQIPKWAPYGIDRDIDSIGPALLTMNDGSEPPNYEIEVLRVEPGRLVEHTWGESLLCWELSADEGGATLTLRHSVPNPEWISPAAAGWHMCFDFAELLMNGIEFGPIVPIVGEAVMEYGWQKLADHYAAALGVSNAQEGEENGLA